MPIKTSVAFFLSFLALVFFPIFFPSLHLLFFAPFLIVIYYRNSFFLSLCKATFVGVIVDLFSGDPVFGITPLTYVLVSSLLYFQKKNFFEDGKFTLPIMTFLFSFLFMVFSFVLQFFFGKALPFSFKFFMTDFLLLSFLDALFAFALFALPFQILKKLSKIRSVR